MFGLIKTVALSAIGSAIGYRVLVYIEENQVTEKVMAVATDVANTALTNLGKVADLLQDKRSTTDD